MSSLIVSQPILPHTDFAGRDLTKQKCPICPGEKLERSLLASLSQDEPWTRPEPQRIAAVGWPLALGPRCQLEGHPPKTAADASP